MAIFPKDAYTEEQNRQASEVARGLLQKDTRTLPPGDAQSGEGAAYVGEEYFTIPPRPPSPLTTSQANRSAQDIFAEYGVRSFSELFELDNFSNTLSGGMDWLRQALGPLINEDHQDHGPLTTALMLGGGASFADALGHLGNVSAAQAKAEEATLKPWRERVATVEGRRYNRAKEIDSRIDAAEQAELQRLQTLADQQARDAAQRDQRLADQRQNRLDKRRHADLDRAYLYEDADGGLAKDTVQIEIDIRRLDDVLDLIDLLEGRQRTQDIAAKDTTNVPVETGSKPQVMAPDYVAIDALKTRAQAARDELEAYRVNDEASVDATATKPYIEGLLRYANKLLSRGERVYTPKPNPKSDETTNPLKGFQNKVTGDGE